MDVLWYVDLHYLGRILNLEDLSAFVPPRESAGAFDSQFPAHTATLD